MTFSYDSRRAAGLLAACAALATLAMAPAAHACDGDMHAADSKQAQRDAWFLRQMQRTDGDVDPRVPQVTVTQVQAQR